MDIIKSAEKILDRMPKDFSKLEQARYVYIQLGKLFTFDEKYWLGNSKERKKIYTASMNHPIDFKKVTKGKKAICVSISRTYKKLLEQIGISSEIIKEDYDDPHVFCAIFINGNMYKADLQRDLKYIQAQRETRHFGRNLEEITRSISEQTMKKMDEKIGYKYTGETYIDENILRLVEELKVEDKLEVKVEKIIDAIRNSPNIENMGYVEQIVYYDWLMTKLLSSKEKDRVRDNFFKIGEGEDRKYAVCLSVGNSKNGYTRFLYEQDGKGYVKTEEEEFIRKLEGGMKIIRDHKIPGIKKQSKDSLDNER